MNLCSIFKQLNKAQETVFRAKDLEEGCSSLNYALFIHCGSELGIYFRGWTGAGIVSLHL